MQMMRDAVEVVSEKIHVQRLFSLMTWPTRSTYLGGELVQWVSVNSVDGQGVVSVNGSESSRDCAVSANSPAGSSISPPSYEASDLIDEAAKI